MNGKNIRIELIRRLYDFSKMFGLLLSFFGPWVELENHTGDIAYTVYFDTLSNVPGPFIAFIWYAPNGPRTVNVIGPASYQISCKGAGVDKIKFKSVSGTGQIIHVYTTL